MRAGLRLRLNRLLGTADWRPPGMSPTAVLIVRHLADPLPGQLAATPTAVRPPIAWETAVQQQLAQLARHATRPYRGHLPPDAIKAAAVLFADEAEMLACLALDAARGLAADRWWWLALRRARPTLPLHEPAHLLRQDPRLTPAILTCLHEWGHTAAIAAILPIDQAVAVLTAVTHACQLPRLPALSPVLPPAPPHPAAAAPAPPWDTFLPPTAVPAAFSATHTCLLGLSLSLTRRAAAVRTAVFQRELLSWWQAASQPAPKTPPHSAPPPAHPAPPDQPAAALTPGISLQTLAVAPRPLSPQPTPIAPRPPRAPTGLARANPAPPTTPTSAKEPAAAAPATAVTASAPQSRPPTAPQTAVYLAEGTFTQLGGIFYLINLMARLDIPACYEETWGLASQVGAWGTLALLAGGLLEPMPGPLQDDPIWAALAELDGRCPDPPHPTPTTHQAAWLAHALPDFRTRLLALLRLNDPAQLVETLLLAQANLHLTTTHVDLVMRLAAISLPVRLAGLDFDPGWQPAFGRVIQFHFR